MTCESCTAQAKERETWIVTCTITRDGPEYNNVPIGSDVCESCYEREERIALGDLARMLEF